MVVLYLVGILIGNLVDIIYRVVDVLKCVDMIVCEDIRVISKLCNYYDILILLKLYYEYNKDKQIVFIIEQLELGFDVVFVFDVGLFLISDFGYELVVVVREVNIKVEIVFGFNVGLMVLMVSGLFLYVYIFLGFLL